jgi:hypothetical protein
LRYQLLTATAGALAYAAKIGADRAILIIHEFVTDDANEAGQESNANDLNLFVKRITDGARQELKVNQLIGPFTVPGKPLFTKPAPLYIGRAIRILTGVSHTDSSLA